MRPSNPTRCGAWTSCSELANGRKVKTLTVVDDCTKKSVQIAVDTSIPALYVTRALDQVKAERGLPKSFARTTVPPSGQQAYAIAELRVTRRVAPQGTDIAAHSGTGDRRVSALVNR